jgi:hypothetical protein
MRLEQILTDKFRVDPLNPPYPWLGKSRYL